jgi:hypothetical protein
LEGPGGADGWIADKSLGQITGAIRAEARALDLELQWARVRVEPLTGTKSDPVWSWADIAVASLLPALFIAVAVAMWIKG